MQDAFFDDMNGVDGPPNGMRKALFLYVKWGGAVLSLMVLGLLVLWAYRLGVRDAREIPVIAALETPARVLPRDPGGTEIAHQGLEVNEILAGEAAQTPGAASLAPAPMVLSLDDDLATAEGEADTDAGDAPAPGQTETALTDPAVDRTAEEILALLTPGDADEAADDIEPPITELRPRRRPGATTDTASSPAPDAAPTTEVAALQPGRSATLDPETLAPGTRLVQLGAFDAADQAEAHWRRLLNAHSDLLGAKQHYVQRANSNGRVFFRLRAVGFDDASAQRALCDSLKARAVDDCIPVTVR